MTELIIALCLVVFIVLISRKERIRVCRSAVCRDYSVSSEHEQQRDAAHLLAEIDARNQSLIEHLKKKYPAGDKSYHAERAQQLLNRYRAGDIREISPNNRAGSTAYTENKRRLVYCLRQKKSGNKLHDINTLMFVDLHELSHMMNEKWGHSESSGFWQLFKFMLRNAAEIGIYNPIDYSRHPIEYCGMQINYNPFFDKAL